MATETTNLCEKLCNMYACDTFMHTDGKMYYRALGKCGWFISQLNKKTKNLKCSGRDGGELFKLKSGDLFVLLYRKKMYYYNHETTQCGEIFDCVYAK
jgi:hypothetical protein